MGPIQKIFYFHAATAWAGMTAFGLLPRESPVRLAETAEVGLAGCFRR